MTLTDPTTVNIVNSCIDCMSHVEIVSNKIDTFFSICEMSREKWYNQMDDGLWCFYGLYKSELIYFAKEKQLLVHTANETALVLSFGIVFIQTYLPWMTEHLLSMGQILHDNLCAYGDQNILTFAHIDTKDVVLTANSNEIHENIYWVDTQIVTDKALFALESIHENSYKMWHQHLEHPFDQVLEKFQNKD